MAKERIQLNIKLSKAQNALLKKHYKQYVQRTKAAEIIGYNDWVRKYKLAV